MIFTGKSVSGYARQKFKESGTVELVMNVKPSALERLSHVTGADIVLNMEDGANRILAALRRKTLLELRFANHLPLGPRQLFLPVSCLITGADLTELAFVKRILLFLFVVAYELNSERPDCQDLTKRSRSSFK